jgi:hypothetical protein
MTDGQSVSMSWCRAPSGSHDQMFVTVWWLLLCVCVEPSLTRGRVCQLDPSFYNLGTDYIENIVSFIVASSFATETCLARCCLAVAASIHSIASAFHCLVTINWQVFLTLLCNALMRPSSNYKLQTCPHVREGVPQACNCMTAIKICSWAPGGCLTPRQTGQLTVGCNITLTLTLMWVLCSIIKAMV